MYIAQLVLHELQPLLEELVLARDHGADALLLQGVELEADQLLALELGVLDDLDVRLAVLEQAEDGLVPRRGDCVFTGAGPCGPCRSS